MRLMLLTETYLPEINGVAMTLARLSDGLVARGHHVQIIRSKQNHLDTPKPLPANPSHVLVWGFPFLFYKEIKLGLPYFGQLRRQIMKFKPDLLHIATEGPLGLAGVLAAHAYGIPIVSSYHTHFLSYSRFYGAVALRKVAFMYFRGIHNATLKTFVPSQTALKQLQGYKFKNLEIMLRGVDTTLFSPAHRSEELRKSWGAAPTDPVMIYVGRIAPEKNLALMFKCFERLKAKHPTAKMVIVGHGPDKEKLQKKHPEYIFAGKRTGGDLATHYASADLFIFPSYTETYGNVIIEAMASGLVVMAYDYAAARDYLVHGQNAYLADYKKEAHFIERFDTLVKSRTQWPTIARSARELTEKISWENMVAKYEESVLKLFPNSNV